MAIKKDYGSGVKLLNYEEEKPLEKEEDEQMFDYGSGVKLLKPIPFGLGAKAVGGATLTTLPSQYKIQSLSLKEEYERKALETPGISQRMRGIGEPPKEYPIEGITVELSEANKKLSSLWWSELKTTEDKGKFLKHENWSPELQEADLEVQRLDVQASKMGVNTGDWIEYGVYATFFAAMAASVLPVVAGLPKNILNQLTYKVEGKTVKGKELLKILQRVRMPKSVFPKAGFGEPSKFDKKVFAKFTEEGGVKTLAERMTKGIKITEVTPRFAFGTKLYAGLPADEIVKSIVEVGKIGASIAKDLSTDPEKLTKVIDLLSVAEPIIAMRLSSELKDLMPPVSKQNTIFNSVAKKVQDIESKIIKTFDIEAPFNKIGAKETGFQVKNYFNNIGVAHEQGLNEIRKLNKFDVKAVTTKEPELKASGQLDYTDITYLSERPGYFVKLTPEERKIASSAKKAVKDFYKGWEKKLTEIGWMEEPFPQSYITRANNRIYGLRKQLKDVKKPEEKTVITNEIKVLQDKIERIKKQKIQFVSVPVKTIFSNAEDNPEVYNKIMSILPKWDRETITVKDLVEVGVLTRKEADIRYIIGEYSDRMGKKYALGKIFETAAKEGLIKPQALAPNWPSARVYVNGRYVDIPQLRGKRLEPFFSDTVTDFFSKGQVMASPIFGTIKMMQFYNPLMMPMYDVWQSAAIGTFLNPVKGAMHIFNGIKDTVKKTDNYWAAYENGIFSKPFSIPYDKFKIQFERAMKGNKLSTFLKEATLPTNWLRMLYSASWHTAWKLDETIRMISFNYLKDKGLTDRRAAQLAALVHSDYASVPPATRRTFNKILFTPTFKITMSKLYLAMLKGGIKVGAKGFKADASSKILGRGALLALAAMFGIKLFFESQGYEEEEVFRKYVKSIETDEGIKENVITLSHPFNIPWRYYYRVKNAWKPQNLNKIEALVDAAKWDLHPIWRVAYDIAKNSNYRIYNPFDKAGNIAFDLALYTFGEFVAISKGILESAETGEIKAENFRLLQKDMGRLKAIIIKPFIFNYARTPESRKVRSYIENLRKEFDYLMRVDPSKNPKVNYQRVENFKNKISEIRKIIDKEVPPKGDIKIKYGSGVEILEKDYGAGVKLLK